LQEAYHLIRCVGVKCSPKRAPYKESRQLMRGAKVTDCGSARQGKVPSGKTAVTNVISGLGQPAKTALLRCPEKDPEKTGPESTTREGENAVTSQGY
jgi:hypothetical protein